MSEDWMTPVSEVPQIVSELRKTFRSGKTLDIAFRKTQLMQLWKMTDENEKDILKALELDVGKPIVESQALEVTALKNEILLMIEKLELWLGSDELDVPAAFDAFSARVYKQPKGVCLVISAWNYPYLLATAPFLGVIAAGCTGVTKPSELAPTTAKLLAKLVPKYLDSSCYRVVNGAEPVVTALLKERFNHILYTGGGKVGKIVMKAAAEHLTPVTLELGGKSPVIVSRNADIKLAAKRVAWGKFTCAGQTCIAPDYALVEDEVLGAFLDGMKEAVLNIYEDKPKGEQKMGRIVNSRHWSRVTALLEASKGEVVVGGESDEAALFIPPTVVSKISLDDSLMSEEIFGPILPVISVPSLDEACDLVPKISDDPLALYLMTEDKDEMEYVLRNTSSGGVSLNDTMMQIGVPHVPLGGVGGSGMGSYHGKASIDTFSHKRSVVHVPSELEQMLEWRYVNGDHMEKYNFYKQNMELKPPAAALSGNV